MKRLISVYHTHIEIYPYELGDFRRIETFYSEFDIVFHKYNPIAYYYEDNTLYLPRGTSLTYLQKNLPESEIVIKKDTDDKEYIKINPLIGYKSDIQKEAIEFLSSEGRFTKGLSYSQFALNLDTGDGKTIAMILAIAQRYKTRAMIIMNQSDLKKQWKREFIKATDIDENRILDISGSDTIVKLMDSDEINYDIFLINHQTLSSFGKRYGWKELSNFFKKIKIGVKVYDEAHKFFTNISMIDFFTNTEKTFYLTATFKRSGARESTMFKKAFSNCYRFGEETLNYESKRKHTDYYYIQFNSNCPVITQSRLYGRFSISPFNYIKYQLFWDERRTFYNVLKKVIKLIENLEGKILIISPTIESTEVIGKFISDNFDKRVVIMNSKINEEVDFNNYDVISATMKLLGTAIDIKGLRVLINTEPFKSEVNLRQLKGRLREYNSTDMTYMFDLVDTSIRDVSTMGQSRLNNMKKYANEIKIINV